MLPLLFSLAFLLRLGLHEAIGWGTPQRRKNGSIKIFSGKFISWSLFEKDAFVILRGSLIPKLVE